MLPDVRSFLNPIPHVSFVQGESNIDYLKRRHDALVENPLFASMEFIADDDEFARRLPLMAAGRDFSVPSALGWAPDGTDLDFGSLSRQLIGYTAERGMTTLFGHEVRDLRQQSNGSWTLNVVNRRTTEKRRLNAKFVFVGAGGGALPLLQKAGIPEVRGFGGFPIGGRFLRSANPVLTGAHRAKVYGRPPLALPHPAGLASRRPSHQRQAMAVVRAVRRLVTEVPEAGQCHRSSAVGQAEQLGVDGQGRAHAGRSGEVPHRPAEAVGKRSHPRLA